MTLEQKIELVKGSSLQEILKGGGYNGTPLLRFVFEIHEKVFGVACKSCADLIPKYVQKIQNINLKTTLMSTERKYRMKSGSVIHVAGTNKYYSDLNITDDVAKKLLKVNPNRSALFAKMPDGALAKLTKEAAAEEAAEAARKEEEANKAAEAQKQADDEAAKSEEAKATEEAKTLEVVADDEPKADAPVKTKEAAAVKKK